MASPKKATPRAATTPRGTAKKTARRPATKSKARAQRHVTPPARPVATKSVTAVTLPAVTSLPSLGQPWPGHGGSYMGVIRGEVGQPDYALVLATEKTSLLKGTWGPSNVLIRDALSELDGMVNTQAMSAAGSDLATRALAVEVDGHRDYYIPARREARLLQINSGEALGKGAHWTSTQSRAWDAHAWVQWFGDGSQYYGHKGNELPVRLVRRVPIQ